MFIEKYGRTIMISRKIPFCIGLIVLAAMLFSTHKYSYSGSGEIVLQSGLNGTWDEELRDPIVIKDGNIYKMWYAGENSVCLFEGSGIGYATSSDGIHWTKYADNPVISPGPAGSWDDHGVWEHSVIRDQDETDSSKRYKMWYSGENANSNSIGYAFSSDGIHWTKYADNPVISPGPAGSWDDECIERPSIIKDQGETDSSKRYKMWYSGENANSNSIGYAFSSDGIHWTKYADNPVLNAGLSLSWEHCRIKAPFVIKDEFEINLNLLYKMWYTGGEYDVVGDDPKYSIGYAFSSDGIHWTKYADNPVISPGPAGSWDDEFICDASVIKDGNVFKVWYEGQGSIWPYNSIGYVCYKFEGQASKCDGEHLNLCLTEADCMDAGGYWYEDMCHSSPLSPPGPIYACDRFCETQCGNLDIACITQCTEYQKSCCEAGVDVCNQSCGPVLEPPQEHSVGMCNSTCRETAPIQVSNGQADICFNYLRPVTVLAGIMSSDFTKVWWLDENCRLSTDFDKALEDSKNLSCPSLALPSEVVQGSYVFWLVTEGNLSSLDWTSGIYELQFYDITR
jgi:predicted GH43/DUF377 family glycosyl hydrolase